VMNAVPRYYIMVLPLLLIAWIMLWQRLAQLVPPRWSDAVLLAGLLGVACMGFARCCKVIGEQHHFNRSEEDEGPKWKAVLEMGGRRRWCWRGVASTIRRATGGNAR